MTVIFKPHPGPEKDAMREGQPTAGFQTAGQVFAAAGEFSVSDDLGAMLCRDYPQNFALATGGGEKAIPPTKNRAMPNPTHNR